MQITPFSANIDATVTIAGDSNNFVLCHIIARKKISSMYVMHKSNQFHYMSPKDNLDCWQLQSQSSLATVLLAFLFFHLSLCFSTHSTSTAFTWAHIKSLYSRCEKDDLIHSVTQ